MSSELTPDFNPIEALLLTAYPNPERRGCVSHEKIVRMGQLQVPTEDPDWNHVWHCSPCFAEFKSFRDQRWKQERSHQTMRNYLLTSAVCLGILGLLVATTLQTRRVDSSPKSESGLASLKLDLSDFEAVRGLSPENVRPSLTLPRRLDEIEVRLPRFAHPGPYQVAIINLSTSSNPVIGSVILEELGSPTLAKVRLDLSRLARGDYSMSFHGGRPAVDFSVPVKVE